MKVTAKEFKNFGKTKGSFSQIFVLISITERKVIEIWLKVQILSEKVNLI